MLTTKDLSSFKWLPSASLLVAKLPLKGDFPAVSAGRAARVSSSAGGPGTGTQRRDGTTEPQVTSERGFNVMFLIGQSL